MKSPCRRAENLALGAEDADEHAMTGIPVRCITLNTWKNEGDYAARLRLMGAGLAAMRPDVVLLQEAFRADATATNTAQVLGGALGMAVAYAPARAKVRSWHGRDVVSESGLAVLVRGEVISSERLPLPSDAAGGERIALIVRARLESGIEVIAGCVHLSHLRDDEVRRREQLEAVLASKAWEVPAALRLLGGDFNASINGEEMTWLAAHPRWRVTEVGVSLRLYQSTHPLPPHPGRPGRRIDGLFAVERRDEPAASVVAGGVALDTPVRGVWPSDHAAVWADFERTPAPTEGGS